MTIISIKPEQSSGDGAVKVEFSDGSSVKITADYMPAEYKNDYFWQTGRELNPAEEEIFRFAASCYRVEKAALRLIARAEQNSLGLTAKLGRRGYDRAVVNAVISGLQNRNLLNDRRYAEHWIRSRLASGNAKSPRWMRASLGKRGIDRNSSAGALDEVLDPETEYTLLLKYIEKGRIGKKEKADLFKSKLKFEGFSSAVLSRYFDNNIN